MAAAPTPTQAPPTRRTDDDDRRILDEKLFKRLDNFKGDEKAWKDWAKKFEVVIGTKNKKFMKAMEKAESLGDAITTNSIGLEDEFVNFDQNLLEKLSAELYDLLFMVTADEALSLVQSVQDMDGLAAWQKLHRNYNPKTLARIMQKIMAVVAPPKIQDIKTVVTMVEEWEKRIKELEADTQERVTDVFKMAIMTAMMPETMQEYIFQQTDETVNYKRSKDKVIALANNRVTMQQGPVPMDIGNVGKGAGYWEDQCAHGTSTKSTTRMRAPSAIAVVASDTWRVNVPQKPRVDRRAVARATGRKVSAKARGAKERAKTGSRCLKAKARAKDTKEHAGSAGRSAISQPSAGTLKPLASRRKTPKSPRKT